jgi:hypothetical protein
MDGGLPLFSELFKPKPKQMTAAEVKAQVLGRLVQ